MATPRVITTPLELAKWIRRVLGDKWYISVGEDESVAIGRTYGPIKSHKFSAFVICEEPVKIHVSVSAKSFPGLVKVVDNELWEKIREEFEKQAIKWQCDSDHDLLESNRKKVGVKPPVGRKPLAITDRSAPAPQVGRQLLLLPPPSEGGCCNWPGCSVGLATKAWGCQRHWRMLPASLQESISRTYRPGQHTQSEDYAWVMKAVEACADSLEGNS